jgi:hypothetical protein
MNREIVNRILWAQILMIIWEDKAKWQLEWKKP